MRPSVSFNYVPEFGREDLGYWESVQYDESGKMQRYTVFEGNSISGAPGDAKSGTIGFNLGNNLEMKVKSKSDTITGSKKIMLIESFNMGTSYDLAKDSLNWSNISFSASTTLFKKIQIRYSSAYSPYGIYTQPFYGYSMLGPYSYPYYSTMPRPTLNTSQYSLNKKLLRFLNAGWNLSVGYDLKPKKQKNKNTNKVPQGSEQQMDEITNNPKLYVDWDNPWSLHVDCNFGYTSRPDLASGEIKREIVQTMRMSGELNLTEKWKFSAQSGYDFEKLKFAYTQVTIYRNLHCWEMRFSWVPYGDLKSWNFQINAKSSLLQDLKLTRKKDFRDNL
jgi:hypothetical protein